MAEAALKTEVYEDASATLTEGVRTEEDNVSNPTFIHQSHDR